MSAVTVPVTEWERLTEIFRDFFAGLGQVTINEQRASFTSASDAVATGFSIDSTGRLASSMPLHGLEVTGSALVFDDDAATVTLVGNDVRYAYRIPPELLGRRPT